MQAEAKEIRSLGRGDSPSLRKLYRREFLKESVLAAIGLPFFLSGKTPRKQERSETELRELITHQYSSLEFKLRAAPDPWDRQRALVVMGNFRITPTTTELFPPECYGVPWPPQGWNTQKDLAGRKLTEANQGLAKFGMVLRESPANLIETAIDRYKEVVNSPFQVEIDPDKPTVNRIISEVSQTTGIPEDIIKTIGWRESCLTGRYPHLHLGKLLDIPTGMFLPEVKMEPVVNRDGKQILVPVWGIRIDLPREIHSFLHPHSPKTINVAYFRKSLAFPQERVLPITAQAIFVEQKLNAIFASAIMSDALINLMIDSRLSSLRTAIIRSSEPTAELTGILFGLYHHGLDVILYYLKAKEEHPRAPNVLGWWANFWEQTVARVIKTFSEYKPWTRADCEKTVDFPFKKYSGVEFFARENFGSVVPQRTFYHPPPLEENKF